MTKIAQTLVNQATISAVSNIKKKRMTPGQFRRATTHYILDHKNKVKEVKSALRWSQWFQHQRGQCNVGHTTMSGFEVSTKFLGLDHSFGLGRHPLLFETCVWDTFKKTGAEIIERYSTYQKALEGHTRHVINFKSMSEMLENVTPNND